MGEAKRVEVRTDDGCYVGTFGAYSSANMLLLANGEPIDLGKVYSAGTSLCIVHCRWEKRPWKYDLPMQEVFYRSLRRTFIGLIEQILRQQGF